MDQVTSASHAAKRFGELRKKAKELPQFISKNNRVDTVILDYAEYEKMYMELQTLKEVAWEFEIMRRLQQANENPNNSSSLREIMGRKEYQEYRAINIDEIPDDELFEV